MLLKNYLAKVIGKFVININTKLMKNHNHLNKIFHKSTHMHDANIYICIYILHYNIIYTYNNLNILKYKFRMKNQLKKKINQYYVKKCMYI